MASQSFLYAKENRRLKRNRTDEGVDLIFLLLLIIAKTLMLLY